LSTFAQPASASTHQASVGNYWYEDDAKHDQTKIEVTQGDQITFTIRAQAVPGHTIDVDAFEIHSPNLNLGDTFTTPPLNKPGTFYLYCRPHEQRGHHTVLVVHAASARTTVPAPKPASQRTRAPTHVASTQATSSPASSAVTPTATLTPVGLGTAPAGSLDRPVPTNPNSLGALTGRTTRTGAPWTRSLWWLAIAAVPIVTAAGVALQRARVAQYQPKFEDVRRARAASKPKPAKPRPRKPKPR
jgi:plastocyanin